LQSLIATLFRTPLASWISLGAHTGILYIYIIYFYHAWILQNVFQSGVTFPSHLRYSKTYTGKMASAIGTKTDSSTATCDLSVSGLGLFKAMNLHSDYPFDLVLYRHHRQSWHDMAMSYRTWRLDQPLLDSYTSIFHRQTLFDLVRCLTKREYYSKTNLPLL
jgi:hypothetical protein